MKTKLFIATLQLVWIFTLCSCSTTYHAPDATKLKAAAQRLDKAIVKTQTIAKKTQTKHEEVEKAANTIFLDSQDLNEKFDHLAKQAPPELQPVVKEIQDQLAVQKQHEDMLQNRVEEESELHKQLANENKEVTAAKTNWDKESFSYQQAAAKLAADATEENKRISSQLWKQKLLSAFGITGAIVFIVCLIGGLIAWKLGKLAIRF